MVILIFQIRKLRTSSHGLEIVELGLKPASSVAHWKAYQA